MAGQVYAALKSGVAQWPNPPHGPARFSRSRQPARYWLVVLVFSAAGGLSVLLPAFYYFGG
jgi:hypothetical protein